MTGQGQNQNDVSLAKQHEEDAGYQEYLLQKHVEKRLRQQTLTQTMELERRAPTPPRPPLPSDWTAIIDQASGRSFYLNETTQDIVFTKTEVFQFEDRKRNAANWALNNRTTVGPTPGVPAAASGTVPGGAESAVTEDNDGTPFRRSKKSKPNIAEVSVAIVPGMVFVSPEVGRHAESEGMYTVDSTDLPTTQDISAFKLPADGTDNESGSEMSVNLLA